MDIESLTRYVGQEDGGVASNSWKGEWGWEGVSERQQRQESQGEGNSVTNEKATAGCCQRSHVIVVMVEWMKD